MWEVEHGPKSGDELNDIRQGADYGWPLVSTGIPDDEFHTSFLATPTGSEDPVLSWSPAISPSGMTSLRGNFYVSALKGFALIELKMSGQKVVLQKTVFDAGERLRDAHTPEGETLLWVLTDGPDGQLYRLEL